MKKGLLLIVVSMIFMIAISAQTTISPMKDGTTGLFSAESDNIMSVTAWQNVVFGDFLLTTSYGRIETQAGANSTTYIFNPNVLNLAGMFSLGSIDMSVAYTGNFGGNIKITKEEKDTLGTSVAASMTDYTVPASHTAQVLLGVPRELLGVDMGIRVGVTIGGSYTRRDLSPLVENSKKSNTLSYTPSLVVGAALTTSGGYSITPSLDMSVGIGYRSPSATYPVSAIGPVLDSNGKVYEETGVFNAYIPAVTAGVGIGFPALSERLSLGMNAKYLFGMIIMPEKYFRKITNSVREEHIFRADSGMNHGLAADVNATLACSDRVSLKGKFALDVGYSNTITGGTKKNTMQSGTVEQTIDLTSVSVIPVLSAAVTYDFTEKLTGFAGMAFQPVAYTLTNTKSYYEDGVVPSVQDGREVIHEIMEPRLTMFGAGLQLNATSQLQAACGVSWTLTETEKLTSLINILSNCNLRFGLTWKDLP